MTDTAPTPEDITRAADELYALVPPSTAVIGDLSTTWPVLAGYLHDILADDRVDLAGRVRRARAALRGREVTADRIAADAAREREASRRPGYGQQANAPAGTLTEQITAGGFDWLTAIYDNGQTFECSICGGRVRAFEDDQQARAAARKHLIDEHLDGIAEMNETAVASAELIDAIEDDDRCQPIGCDAGHHLPGCKYIEVDDAGPEPGASPQVRYRCKVHPEGHAAAEAAAACDTHTYFCPDDGSHHAACRYYVTGEPGTHVCRRGHRHTAARNREACDEVDALDDRIAEVEREVPAWNSSRCARGHQHSTADNAYACDMHGEVRESPGPIVRVPDTSPMENQTQPIDHRAQTLADFRELLDFLAARPEVPIDRYGNPLSYSVASYVLDDDEAGLAELARIAAALGVPVTDVGGREPKPGETHFFARKTIGNAEYQANYIIREHMAAHDVEQAYVKDLRSCGCGGVLADADLVAGKKRCSACVPGEAVQS